MSVIGNLDLIGLVSVAKDMVDAGLEKHRIEHVAGNMYLLKSGDTCTHWFRFTGGITTFHKMTHLYKDYYILYQNRHPQFWYNCVTKNCAEIENDTCHGLIRDGIMADVLQIFEKNNLHISRAFSNRVTYICKVEGSVYIWFHLKYNYIFAHVFPLCEARENILFRVNKQSEIAPYLNRIAGLNVENTARTFGCCELTERYLKSTGFTFPFRAEQLTKISREYDIYSFHYDGKIFNLRATSDALAHIEEPKKEVEYPGHKPSSYHVEQAIKKIDKHIQMVANSGSNSVFIWYDWHRFTPEIITWLDNLCKHFGYKSDIVNRGYRIFFYGEPD